MAENLKHTALYNLHIAHGAKMVPFAGYEMPVQYKDMGVMKEHLHTREQAGVFDVSHMGQIFIGGGHDPAPVLEKVIPSDIQGMKSGQMRYTVLLNDQGGIIDDLIVTRLGEHSFYIVLNAARIEQDLPRLQQLTEQDNLTLEHDQHRVLVAIQGPKAVDIVDEIFPGACDINFMHCKMLDVDGHTVLISRAGYTGEDGFEISIPEPLQGPYLEDILKHDSARLIGLGARDSLRLEAGLCLYGHDLNEDLSPVEAGLSWVIQKNRRERRDFAGAERIMDELTHGTKTKRVGILPDGAAPLREGVELCNQDGHVIGIVTSGTYAPSLKHPVAMGYVNSEYAKTGTVLNALLRGKSIPVKVSEARFIESKTKRGKAK